MAMPHLKHGSIQCTDKHPVARLFFGIIAVSAMFWFMGCSGETTSVAEKAAVNACSLVTQAEMEAILQCTLNAPEEKVHTGVSVCNYTGEDSTSTPTVFLSFSLLVSSTGKQSAADAYAQYIADLKSQLDMEVTEVPGIGDKAGWNAASHQLVVYRKGWMVLIGGSPADRSTLEVNRQIAEKLLTRLP